MIIGPNVLSIKAIGDRYILYRVIDNGKEITKPMIYQKARRRCANIQLDLSDYNSADIVYLDVGSNQYILRTRREQPMWYELRIGTIEEVSIEE